MGLIYYVVDLFIKTMGITPPSAASRRRAAFFILALMVVMVIGVTGVGFLLHSAMR